MQQQEQEQKFYAIYMDLGVTQKFFINFPQLSAVKTIHVKHKKILTKKKWWIYNFLSMSGQIITDIIKLEFKWQNTTEFTIKKLLTLKEYYSC